ncbi:MAG: tRNA lysidine(34) synthetase TilS [Brevundimonas aurantiaca]|uniref:tRNA lysidine(34) synthetase TilS n=1 Tax=Brevundimonas aurantiaca TaxID=74316 RepID=UPI00391BDBEA
MQLTIPSDGGTGGLQSRLFARLDDRLTVDDDRPVALALSGGGDSIALMRLTAAWAQARGRPVLALTVDHGLNPDSPAWTRFAGEAAQAVGCAWRGLVWTGDKPTAGLTAAARGARHRLIAEAARAAGARVVLMAHTADDAAEADLMRAEGSTLGRVREWAPSPVWPEGRGLMLLRPLLGERRETLRAWLRDQGADWIEDPANADPRFGRSRARRRLADRSLQDAVPPPELPPAIRTEAAVGVHFSAEGLAQTRRDIDARALATALVCIGGGSTPPRGERLERLIRRLRDGEDFAAVLCGTRVEAEGRTVLMMREAGELARTARADLDLVPGAETVWDGRFVFEADEAGWRVGAARDRLAQLAPSDRAALGRLPSAARGAEPVLIRDDEGAPVLASPAVRRRDLAPERLRLALGETTHEDDLIAPPWRNAAEAPIFRD